MDSSLASWTKLQVFTTTTSAWAGDAAMVYPAATSCPSMTSASTWFFGQPKLTTLTDAGSWRRAVPRRVSRAEVPISTQWWHASQSVPRQMRFSAPPQASPTRRGGRTRPYREEKEGGTADGRLRRTRRRSPRSPPTQGGFGRRPWPGRGPDRRRGPASQSSVASARAPPPRCSP